MVHGFAVSESGHKMSKSVGNVVDPDDVINGGKVRAAASWSRDLDPEANGLCCVSTGRGRRSLRC